MKEVSKKDLIKEPKNNLQKFIDEKLWSNPETARKAGLAERTIKKMLNREKTFRNSKIKAAKPFGVPAKEIFPEDPEL